MTLAWLGMAVLLACCAVLAAGYWVCMSPFSQLLGPFPYRAATTAKVAALTFDDGPNEPFTTQIADFLDSRGIQATFFQVGRAVQAHPEVTGRLLRSGHVIGHHGYAHQFTTYLRPRALAEDMRKGEDAFTGLGLRPALYRPPWLLRIPALRALAGQHGMRVILGEFCHALEVFQPGPGRIARRATAKARPGSIIIFHDGYDGKGGNRASTVAAVKLVVDELTSRGYTFTTIDKLLGVPAYRTEPQPSARA